MEKLTQYFRQKVVAKFTGVVEVPFQHGEMGNIKEHNCLSKTMPFAPTTITKTVKRVEHWQKDKLFGIIKIPFEAGTAGQAIEIKVIKLDEL